MDMRGLKKVIANSRWWRITVPFGVSVAMVGLIFFALSLWFEDLGILELGLTVLFVSALGDAYMAWQNEQANAAGKTRLYNDIIGDLAAADQTFSVQGKRFSGKVRMGRVRWEAVSDGPISKGEKVRVSGRERLVLRVERQRFGR